MQFVPAGNKQTNIKINRQRPKFSNELPKLPGTVCLFVCLFKLANKKDIQKQELFTLCRAVNAFSLAESASRL